MCPRSSSEEPSSATEHASASAQTRLGVKVSLRACDACAIRKVKCGSIRPCPHCITNNLDCTLLRQKKKSGPKNLHKKTLENIKVCVDSAGKLVNSPGIFEDVLEILAIIPRNQIVSEIVESLTVLSLSANHDEYLHTVKDASRRMASSATGESLPVALPAMLSVWELSKLCVAYTLCLLTFETALNMTELNDVVFDNLRKPLERYSYLQNDLIHKVTEYVLVIETEIRLSMRPIDQTIFYNQALVLLHLYNYHQVCVLRMPAHRKVNKFLHLRQSINYLQLLQQQQLESETFTVQKHQVYEVYEILYIIERLNFFLLDKNCLVNGNAVMLMSEKESRLQPRSLDGKNQLYRLFCVTLEDERYLAMFKFFNDFALLRDFSNNNNQETSTSRDDEFALKEFLQCCTIHKITVHLLDQLIQRLFNVEKSSESMYSSFMLIFSILIIFKADMARTILAERRLTVNQTFLHELVNRLNLILQGTDLGILKVKCHNYQLVPQLLTILKLSIELLDSVNTHIDPSWNTSVQSFELQRDYFHQLVRFLQILLTLSPKGYNLVQYIRGSSVLSQWFAEMDETHCHMEQFEPNVETPTIEQRLLFTAAVHRLSNEFPTEMFAESIAPSMPCLTQDDLDSSQTRNDGSASTTVVCHGEAQVKQEDTAFSGSGKNWLELLYQLDNKQTFEPSRAKEDSNSVSDLFLYYMAAGAA